jgi:hypothetical protein
MSNEVSLNTNVLETVMLGGDLSVLSPENRVVYYQKVCESLGLNPLTKPFEYMKLQNKLTLYARKDATEQLRKLHNISIEVRTREVIEDCYCVWAKATDKHGRCDESMGAVSITGLKGEARANAMMKAETKAKRRVTLSIAGLGMLDEHEVETIPGVVVGEPVVAIEGPMVSETLKLLLAYMAAHDTKQDTINAWLKQNNVSTIRSIPESYAQKIIDRFKKHEEELCQLESEQAQQDEDDVYHV